MSEKTDRTHIRNFSIIAHIDHGKSTIADRLLEITKTVAERDMMNQVLDDMDLERERGITIKAHPVTKMYQARDKKQYQINFIDTPGHVDFSYEVSRSLAACEGALLIVDAAQGVQAQSMANVALALERGLVIIPIINKIDLPAADVEGTLQQIQDVLGLDVSTALQVSAKSGLGIEEIPEIIIAKVPPPEAPADDGLRALIFDSEFDSYRGVIVYVRVMSGILRKKQSILFMSTGKHFEVLSVGILVPQEKVVDSLGPGEVGFIIAGVKSPADVQVGDTITEKNKPVKEPLPGFQKIVPVVFAGIYPIDSSDFEKVRDALSRLQLNDSALRVEQESSMALGFGFRCGFLGLLHLEIVFERLQREFGLDIITTAPNVSYRFTLNNETILEIANSAQFPDPANIAWIEEPWMLCRIIVPSDFLGAVMSLAMGKRGEQISTDTMDANRLLLTYKIPLNEIITDFNDKLKSVTRGYGSFDYEFASYEISDIVKLDILVNGELVDAFSCMVHRSKAAGKGKALCKKLVEVIPRQQFKVPIQAAIGGKIVARETISALSKNVTAKCYGGDITRKMKLWKKQAEGKKRMKEIGKVNIPQSAFMDVLKSSE